MSDTINSLEEWLAYWQARVKEEADKIVDELWAPSGGPGLADIVKPPCKRKKK